MASEIATIPIDGQARDRLILEVMNKVKSTNALPAASCSTAPQCASKATSLLIPCRNEERHIEVCVNSLLPNVSPRDDVEILVIDAMSTDRTRDILVALQNRWPQIRILDNPHKLIPVAMNIGLRHAQGEFILKIDAHSNYPPNYVFRCVQALVENKADNAGGIGKIMPAGDTLTAKTIALALAHPFASGNARVKIGADAPRWADSAAFGCWRKEFLEKMGGWNENLAGSSDMDLNARLKDAGGRILLDPSIQVSYYADADFLSFWRHNFADGVWATYVLKFRSKAWAWRHWVPMFFLLSLLGAAIASMASPIFTYVLCGIVSCYLLASLGCSFQIAKRETNLRYLLTLPCAFGIRHLAHGIGALYGAVLLAIPGNPWKGRRSAKS